MFGLGWTEYPPSLSLAASRRVGFVPPPPPPLPSGLRRRGGFSGLGVCWRGAFVGGFFKGKGGGEGSGGMPEGLSVRSCDDFR